MNQKSIIFLHLSDMHFTKEKDISDLHIRKIVDSLKSYKEIQFDNILIIISGDITYSGERYQFSTSRKALGSLITYLNNIFRCHCTVLVVPGNHDVCHSSRDLDVDQLNDGKYAENEAIEHKKLNAFYDFSKYNHCFQQGEIYFDKKVITVNGIKIQVNLINNAIFSTLAPYKGLLYLPNDQIVELSKGTESDLTISIMHHSPDCYRDEIKYAIEDLVIKKSNILFYGHEHHNYSKQTSFEGSTGTVLQSCGALCDNGDWINSSYIVGILDIKSLKYKYQRFAWNDQAQQYEHSDALIQALCSNCFSAAVSSDFQEFLDEDDNKKYFVLPSVIYHGNSPSDDQLITSFTRLKNELANHHYSIIVGTSNIGKTMLLKELFNSYASNKFSLFGSPEMLIGQSKTKKQNISKLIKALFEDVYGNNDSLWQQFEQESADNCVFIFDDFEQIDGININEFFSALSSRFGTIILSSSRIIDFDPLNISIDDDNTVAKFEIKAPVGQKRRELIRKVVTTKADDKSEKNIEAIVHQIDLLIKTQMNIIPPEPFYIIQMSENYMNNVGEAFYKSNSVFGKVFEYNLTNKIKNALSTKNSFKSLTVDLLYTLLGKIAYYIHFNKAYPIKRNEVDQIISKYTEEYGTPLETENILQIAKAAKIIVNIEESSEAYRFRNKSILAYFVAKEITSKEDTAALYDVINKACFNICTDILLFVIYLTDKTYIIEEILSFIKKTISSDSAWNEFSIPETVPSFITNTTPLPINHTPVNKIKEKQQIAKNEENIEEKMASDFVIKDIYDWDDAAIEKYNNKLFRMTSLLQIIAKCLPNFEHLLKKEKKRELIGLLYTLPNSIFMFWSSILDENYEEIVEEFKAHPYFSSKQKPDREIDKRIRYSLVLFALNALLNLYYIPVLNATGKNTFQYLNNAEFFDYSQNSTYLLEHLMIMEQVYDSDEFVTSALRLKKSINDQISTYLLQCIVRHGLITRNDTKENIDRLESKFFPKAQKNLLIERAKVKHSKR